MGFSGEENKTLNGNFLYEGIITDASDTNKLKDNIIWIKISGIDDRDIEISRDILLKMQKTKSIFWMDRTITNRKQNKISKWMG